MRRSWKREGKENLKIKEKNDAFWFLEKMILGFPKQYLIE